MGKQVTLSWAGTTPTLDQLNEYWVSMGRERVYNADDVRSNHATHTLAKEWADVGENSGEKLIEKLTDLDLISLDLSQMPLKEQNRVAAYSLSSANKTSRYLSSSLDERVLAKNKEIIAASLPLEQHVYGWNLRSLDDIQTQKHATSKLGRILGFRQNNRRQLADRLVEHGFFSYRLSDYSSEIQEEVAQKVLSRVGTGRGKSPTISLYFDKTLDPKILNANRRTLVGTKAFDAYLKKANEDQDVECLDQVGTPEATISHVLGVNLGDLVAYRNLLADYEKFSKSLKAHPEEVQSRVIAKVIADISDTGNKSVFFYGQSDPRFLGENQEILVGSDEFDQYMQGNNLLSLADIVRSNSIRALETILTADNQVAVLRERLVELGYFSHDMANPAPGKADNNERTERIAQQAIEKLEYRRPEFYFLNGCPQEFIPGNREVFLGTKAASDFFVEEGIDLENPSTFASAKAKRFLSAYMGETTSSKKRGTPKYSRLVTVWKDSEKEELRQLLAGQSDPGEYIRSRAAFFQEKFGRSAGAIVSQVNNQRSPEENAQGRTPSPSTYVFPSAHAQEFGGSVHGYFTNTSFLLEQTGRAAFVPVIGYESAVHGQHTHVTVPIRFKGNSLTDYNQGEQQVLTTLAHYVANRRDFTAHETNWNDLMAPQELAADPRILEIRNPVEGKPSYTQLIFRRSLNPYHLMNPPTKTEAIRVDNMIIAHFKHEQELTFANTRVA